MSSPFSRTLPARPDLAQQGKQAKELLERFAEGDAESRLPASAGRNRLRLLPNRTARRARCASRRTPGRRLGFSPACTRLATVLDR